jgi:endonuclease/exonuclease/phosphatase family metal-dependent hydrolase
VAKQRGVGCQGCPFPCQVHTLVKGLEKIAASADIPMLVAGDFNSIPGSAAHSLLVKHSVDADHPVRNLSTALRKYLLPVLAQRAATLMIIIMLFSA